MSCGLVTVNVKRGLDEEEVVDEEAEHRGEDRRPEPPDDRASRARRPGRPCSGRRAAARAMSAGGDRAGGADGRDREHVAAEPRRAARLARAPRGAGAAASIAGDDAHVDRSAVADHLVDRRRPSHERAPARARRLAEDDLAHVALAREAQELLGHVARPGCVTASPPSCSASRSARCTRSRSASGRSREARRLDEDGEPRRVAALGHAPRRAHERARRAGPPLDRDQDALGHRPQVRRGRARRMRLHLLVDVLGGLAQRELAERGQVAGLEVVPERALGLLRARRPCPRAGAGSAPRATGRSASPRRRGRGSRSGTVSRTRTPVICATTSFRLSRCWMLTVV